MSTVNPAGPAVSVEQLARPTSGYRLQAWLAVVGLLGFVSLYLALTGWFAWTAFRVLDIAFNSYHGNLIHWIVGLCAGFLALFMVKALFFVKHGGEIDHLEVKREEEPALFDFLHQLADDAGAPRPHRVFLSARVNAAVFYDLSPLNLLFPSKKNLEIGLALVNVLTLSELKAVLAHEFGHFAQRSMAVGRWVYIAQQIAAHIIDRRDALDGFLRGLSNFDIRVAWIGWLMRLVVWSLRAVLETAFSLVVMAQRALSREMEFQADLVAVSLTGSDALVHALHKLQAADEAWDRSLSFAGGELSRGEATPDIFAVQLRILERMRAVLHDPGYGVVPEIPAGNPAAHRVFKADIAQPPRMWATHPMNHEREENAKRVYIPSPVDTRSAWVVFRDPPALRARATAHLLKKPDAKAKALNDTLAAVDHQFAQQYLHGVYRGSYLGRSVVRHAATAQALYDDHALATAADKLASLYPDSLVQELEAVRQLEREVGLLEALRDGVYTAPGGVIRHRDRELKRRELPQAIEAVRRELAEAQARVNAHDTLVRTAHLSAARRVGRGWEAYLRGLAAVLHYADHAEADLRDAQGMLGNVWSVITADRSISEREIKRLLKGCEALYVALEAVYRAAPQLRLDDTLAARVGFDDWAKALGELELPPADRNNINDWLQHIDSWVNHAAGGLSTIRLAALEQLLTAESQVARYLREGAAPADAPAPSKVPAQYPTLTPGSERQRQRRLGLWDRFQTADGFVPGLARFAVSTSIVGAAAVAGGAMWMG